MNLDFTPHEWNAGTDERILRGYLIEGVGLYTLQQELGINNSTIRRRLRHLGVDTARGGDRGNTVKYYEIMGQEIPDEYQPCIRPARPVYEPRRIPIARPDLQRAETYDEVSLHWSDTHFPFQDPSAINCLYAIAADVCPSRLVMHGDLIDFWQISNHRPPLETKLKAWEVNIQDSIDMGVEHLGIMCTLAEPHADKIILLGNHEDRFERLLADMQLNSRIMALMRIPKIRETLNLDYILGLEESGWQMHNYLEGDRYILHDRLLCIHGYRSNSYSAKSHLQDYGKSVLYGHSHRIQNWTSRDLRGTDASWNMGCLCDLNPHWRQRPNWHQGFAVVVWKKIEEEWFYSIEQVRVHEGVAIYRDKIYRG